MTTEKNIDPPPSPNRSIVFHWGVQKIESQSAYFVLETVELVNSFFKVRFSLQIYIQKMYMYTKCMQEINDLKLIIQHKPIFKLCIITCIFVVQKNVGHGSCAGLSI